MIDRARITPLVRVSLAALIVGCAPADRVGDDSASAAPTPPDSLLGESPAATDALLDSVTTRVIGFLRGQDGFPGDVIADSIVVYAGPEGGGGSRVYLRNELRDRSDWMVPVNSHEARIAPAEAMTQVTMKRGVHFRCFEYTLASRFPRLAELPHVGVKMEPPGADSCLQSWNMTLVFDDLESPRLVAVVYDQWEW